MADSAGFQSVHDFAALRRHVLLAGESRSPAVRAPSALNVISALLANAAIGSIICAFVWGLFGYMIFGTSAFTMLFSAVAVGFVLGIGSILLEQDADGTFDWQMPGASLREKIHGHAGNFFSCAFGAALTPAYLLAFTMPADTLAGLGILLALATLNLSAACTRASRY